MEIFGDFLFFIFYFGLLVFSDSANRILILQCSGSWKLQNLVYSPKKICISVHTSYLLCYKK